MVTTVQCLSNTGAILGGGCFLGSHFISLLLRETLEIDRYIGTTIGYLSQIFGRRFSIIVISVVGGALLYPYTFVSDKRVIASAFFEQFAVQGQWVQLSSQYVTC